MLSADRMTLTRDGTSFADPVAASTVIYAGAMYALDASGNAVPAGTSGSGIARAVAQCQADNSAGAAGDVLTAGRTGVFRFANSASTDLIDRTCIGAVCYIVADDTVAKTSNSSARKAAGTVVDVDDGGVWVRIG